MPVVFAAGCAPQTDSLRPDSDLVVISVVGTNDIHGQFGPAPGRGGLTTISGYVQALRDARAGDGGVLLVDGGDMWQGSLESNLSEGALMVEAYNALGYAAATIGNHEFDFGPVGPATVPATPADDPRGNLKQRATEMRFPLLAANLIDENTGKPVAWPNVKPSTIVEVAGVRIGITGVLTRDTLLTTISGNVGGLVIAPLTESVVREARQLRAAGASMIVVVAHAGGRCTEYGNPHDLSSCRADSEILVAAQELPPGLVDAIVGGHEGFAIAHFVNGVAVTVGRSYSRAFGRTDFWVDRESGAVRGVLIHRPQESCIYVTAAGDCAWDASEYPDAVRATYEGRTVAPLPAVEAIARRAAEPVTDLKLEELGVRLETPFTLQGNPESALGNLVTDILRESLAADVSIHNVTGGLRSSLPAGDLTYGDVFQMFPFDNRIVVLDLSGAELRRIMATQAQKPRYRAGMSGVRVRARCVADEVEVTLFRDDGSVIADDDRVSVVVNNFLATGGDRILTPITPPDGLDFYEEPQTVRDVIADWFRKRGGTMTAADYSSEAARRWEIEPPLPASCTS